jgi:uncharacterized protein YndB with AHSA1/START domain
MIMQGTGFVVDRKKLEISNTRIFDAPRERVWKVITDQALIPKWWAPRTLTTIVDKMEVKVGGTWRFIQHDAQGNEFAYHGEYREIVEPERLINTFIFEAYPDHVIVETATFEDLPGGKTRLTQVSRYETIEDLDGMVSAGMEVGVRESMERLVEVLEELKERS